MKELQEIVRTLFLADSGPSVLATLVAVEGSSYRRPGARLLVRADGRRAGSISGGCLEEDLLSRARRVLAEGTAEAVVYDTTSENDLVWGVGLGCHGVVRVLLERLPPQPEWALALADNFAARRRTELAVVHRAAAPSALGTQLGSDPPGATAAGDEIYLQIVPPPPALAIFGAGDDSQPLARLAKELGWHVTVADPRPAFATESRFSTADALVGAPSEELAQGVFPGSETGAGQTLAVVMTHHYVHDVPLLRSLLPLNLDYLGLLGPRKRAERILEDLARSGMAIAPGQLERLHAPVGLDLGADAPEQVALAIMAEMQATLTARDGRPLRLRTRPIHG